MTGVRRPRAARRSSMTPTTRRVTIRRESRHRRDLARQATAAGGHSRSPGRSHWRPWAPSGWPVSSRSRPLASCRPGCPDPSELDSLGFAQPTIVYDRAGKVELGRFEDQRRRVLAFDSIPKTVLDATTAAEDRTFWDNAGIDVPALISAAAENASGTGERGASTITQQLVRARLLPDDVIEAGADRYVRKVKEIIQSLRLSDEYPGRGRQAARHHRLPQRDLLRARGVRHRCCRRDLLRRLRPLHTDGRPGRAPGRPAQVPDDARPVSLRRAGRQGPPRRTRRIGAGRPARLGPRGDRRHGTMDHARDGRAPRRDRGARRPGR